MASKRKTFSVGQKVALIRVIEQGEHLQPAWALIQLRVPQKVYAEALTDNDSTEDLHFRKGEVLRVLERETDDWWWCQDSSGRRGCARSQSLRLVTRRNPPLERSSRRAIRKTLKKRGNSNQENALGNIQKPLCLQERDADEVKGYLSDDSAVGSLYDTPVERSISRTPSDSTITDSIYAFPMPFDREDLSQALCNLPTSETHRYETPLDPESDHYIDLDLVPLVKESPYGKGSLIKSSSNRISSCEDQTNFAKIALGDSAQTIKKCNAPMPPERKDSISNITQNGCNLSYDVPPPPVPSGLHNNGTNLRMNYDIPPPVRRDTKPKQASDIRSLLKNYSNPNLNYDVPPPFKPTRNGSHPNLHYDFPPQRVKNCSTPNIYYDVPRAQVQSYEEIPYVGSKDASSNKPKKQSLSLLPYNPYSSNKKTFNKSNIQKQLNSVEKSRVGSSLDNIENSCPCKRLSICSDKSSSFDCYDILPPPVPVYMAKISDSRNEINCDNSTISESNQMPKKSIYDYPNNLSATFVKEDAIYDIPPFPRPIIEEVCQNSDDAYVSFTPTKLIEDQILTKSDLKVILCALNDSRAQIVMLISQINSPTNHSDSTLRHSLQKDAQDFIESTRKMEEYSRRTRKPWVEELSMHLSDLQQKVLWLQMATEDDFEEFKNRMGKTIQFLNEKYRFLFQSKPPVAPKPGKLKKDVAQWEYKQGLDKVEESVTALVSCVETSPQVFSGRAKAVVLAAYALVFAGDSRGASTGDLCQAARDLVEATKRACIQFPLRAPLEEMRASALHLAWTARALPGPEN